MPMGGEAEPSFSSFTFHPSLEPFTLGQQGYLSAHPHEGYNYVATGALVFDKADPIIPRVLLIQRAPGDSMPNRWEVPGGGCDDEDESILHAVARELWEEAGLRANRISRLVEPPYLFTSRSGKEITKFNFMVQAQTDATTGSLEVRLNPEEHQRFVWASEADVRSKKAGEVELEFTTKELEDTILRAFEQSRRE